MFLQAIRGAGIICAALLVLAPFCAGGQESPANPKIGGANGQPGPPSFPDSVKVVLRLNKAKCGPKTPVAMSLTVQNTAKETAHISFSSGKKYDFEIRKGKGASGALVWKWSTGRMFPMMFSTVSVEPGKSLVFTETYKPGDKDGFGKLLPELAPGDYTVIGTLAASARTHPTATASLTITK